MFEGKGGCFKKIQITMLNDIFYKNQFLFCNHKKVH